MHVVQDPRQRLTWPNLANHPFVRESPDEVQVRRANALRLGVNRTSRFLLDFSASPDGYKPDRDRDQRR
jgi:hypothetical protein